MSIFPALANYTADRIIYSDALGGLCGWTTSTTACYLAAFPLVILVLVLVGLVVFGCIATPQRSVIDRPISIHQSPFIPNCYKELTPKEIVQRIAPISDVPLKVFLPRIGLSELVSPCAAKGVASLRELLRMNRVAQRDVGIGMKETRILKRALERRIKTREAAAMRAAAAKTM
eukprot:GILI01028864.1.p1 GENE.GILI01028864.1~~GILI01028864.1.p1  ORF type:complete len:174 (-),score=20.47 GILI01028864.1:6-527(-)